MPVTEVGPRPQTNWIDRLRSCAAVSVVIIHVAAEATANLPPSSREWQFGNLLQGFTRWSVDVFVMLTGALLIASQEPGDRFLRRRFTRLVPPLITWTTFYLVWRSLKGAHPGTREVLVNLLQGNPYHHLWFLFILPGLYLIIPVLRMFVQNVSPRTAWMACLTGLAASILHVSLTTIWQSGTTVFMNWVVWVPVLLLGYLLNQTTQPVWGLKVTFIASGLAVSGLAALLVNRPYGLNLAYGYHDPFVLVAATSLFLVFRQAPGDPGQRSQFGRLTFGIYLIHPFVQDLLRLAGVHQLTGNAFIEIPVISLLTVLFSYGLCLALSKIRPLKPLVE